MIEPFKSREIWRKEVYKRCCNCYHFADPMGYYSCGWHQTYCEEIKECDHPKGIKKDRKTRVSRTNGGK